MRIWKKRSIEGYTEEHHSQETKDGKYSVGIELNFSFPPLTYDRRTFDAGSYTAYVQEGEEIIDKITEYCHTARDAQNLFKKAKELVENKFYEQPKQTYMIKKKLSNGQYFRTYVQK